LGNWPKTGCSVIAVRENQILMIKRGKQPYVGYWSLPGGSQEVGETLEACAQRELLEETGLKAEKIKFAAIRDLIGHNEDGSISHHFIIATYLAEQVSGELRAGDDAKEAEWFALEQLDSLKTTPNTVAFIRSVLGKLKI